MSVPRSFLVISIASVTVAAIGAMCSIPASGSSNRSQLTGRVALSPRTPRCTSAAGGLGRFSGAGAELLYAHRWGTWVSKPCQFPDANTIQDLLEFCGTSFAGERHRALESPS